MNVWYHENPKPRKRPWWVSRDVWKRTEGVFTARLFGVEYFFPVTKETRPFALMIQGEKDPWAGTGARSPRARQALGERGIQDVISCLLLQTRETEVADAATMLAQDIRDKLFPLLTGKIRRTIEEKRTALGIMGPEE